MKIVHAFKELVREGDASPSAAAVALRAGVGARTVYRCFEDMETLYREMTAVLHAEFLPRTLDGLDGLDRPERLARLVENRCRLYRDAEPFLFASEQHRHRYEALARDYDFLRAMEREKLSELIDPDRAWPGDDFEALAGIVCFGFWRRLRVEQSLSQDAASRIMRKTAFAVLGASGVPGEIG